MENWYKLLLDYAIESASELGHFHVEPENLLLGLLRVEEGVAVRVLLNLGVDLRRLRQQVLEIAPRGSDLAITTQVQAQPNQSRQPLDSIKFPQDTPTDFTSAEISARFCALLFAWVEPRRLGRVIGARTEFQLPDGDVLMPQISFVSAEPLKRVPRTYPELAPELIVEIKSAFDHLALLQEKIQRFLDLGALTGLLINPNERTVTVYSSSSELLVLRESDLLTLPTLLPGWDLSVSQLWSPVFNE